MPDYATVMCCGMGVFSLWTGLKQLRFARESTSWPTAQAVITRSHLDEFHDGQLAVQWNPKSRHWNLRYQFTVNGITYKNHRASYNIVEFPRNKKLMATLVASYPVASTHTVYYMPADPNISTLMPGFHWSASVMSIVGLLFLSAGMYLFIQ